jgi:hypothetical protein
MVSELIVDLSLGNNHLINALQTTYPEIDQGQIEVLGNAILGRLSQTILDGELPASVRLRPDGDFDIRVWSINNQGGE